MTDFTYNPDTNKVGVGHADPQHMRDIITFCKGWHKFSPFVGACALSHLHDELATQSIEQDIVGELKRDGVIQPALTLDQEGHFLIQGQYETNHV